MHHEISPMYMVPGPDEWWGMLREALVGVDIKQLGFESSGPYAYGQVAVTWTFVHTVSGRYGNTIDVRARSPFRVAVHLLDMLSVVKEICDWHGYDWEPFVPLDAALRLVSDLHVTWTDKRPDKPFGL